MVMNILGELGLRLYLYRCRTLTSWHFPTWEIFFPFHSQDNITLSPPAFSCDTFLCHPGRDPREAEKCWSGDEQLYFPGIPSRSLRAGCSHLREDVP